MKVRYFYLTIAILVILLLLTEVNTTHNILNNKSIIIIEDKEIKAFKNVIFFSSEREDYQQEDNFITIIACDKISVKLGDSISCITHFKSNSNQQNQNYQIIYELFDENANLIAYFHEFNHFYTNETAGFIISSGAIPFKEGKTVELRGNAGDEESFNALSVNLEVGNYTKEGLFIAINTNSLYKDMVDNNKETNDLYLNPYSFGKTPSADMTKKAFCIVTDNENLCVNTNVIQNIFAFFLSINEIDVIVADAIFFLLALSIVVTLHRIKPLKKIKHLFTGIISTLIILCFILMTTNPQLASFLFNLIFFIILTNSLITFFKR